MSDQDIFSFPYGAFIKLRLEFVLLRDDDLQARIMRIIESWMIDKKGEWEKEVVKAANQGTPEPPEPQYWCTLSYGQIITQLYKFNSSRGSGKKGKPNGKEVVEGKSNTITRVTVAAAMHALINDNYVLVRPNPNPEKEYEASQYSLNIPLIQEHLQHLPRVPMSYLGSNGRINGIPCKDFLHPPEELISELGHDPRTKSLHGNSNYPRKNSSHGNQNKRTSHVKEVQVGDVKPVHHLIDKGLIDSSLDKSIECVEASVSSPDTKTPTPIDTSLNPLGDKGTKDQEPEKEVTTELPLEKLPWCAEKALRITETIVRTEYINRDTELKACAKILETYRPTEDVYIKVVLKILPWYRGKQKILYPSNLLAKNTKGMVWFEELAGEVTHFTSSPAPVIERKQEPEATSLTRQEAEQLFADVMLIAKKQHYDIQAQVVQEEDGWTVEAQWDGFPVFCKNWTEWEDLFTQELKDRSSKKPARI